MDINIFKAQKHHLSFALDILNKATQKLLAKGVMQWEYPWDENEVLSYIQKGEFYIAFSGDNAVACVGIKDFAQNFFNPQDTTGVYMYHLAVDPEYSGMGVGAFICRWLKNWRRENKRTVYFDCWAGNTTLIGFYTKNGFVSMGEFPEEDYFIHAFKTED